MMNAIIAIIIAETTTRKTAISEEVCGIKMLLLETQNSR